MTDMDELYADVFQIPLTSPRKSPVKRKSNHCSNARVVKVYEKNIDENSVDIYSDLSLDCNYHPEIAANQLKDTDTKSNKMSEVCGESIEDNLDLYTDVMTAELTEKEKSKQELNKLRLENERLAVENKKLQHFKEQLSKNISSLFLTAKKELEKKEEEINQLRQIIEQLKKTDINNTRDRHKSHVDDTKDKNQSYVVETKDRHKSHMDKTRDKHRHKSQIDEIKNKQKSQTGETMDNQKSHLIETKVRQKSHIDETRLRGKAYSDETRNKQKSHVDETRDKQKSHDETRDKQKSHVDETRNKRKLHVDETRDKQKSHVDETRDKQKSHVDETRNKRKLHVVETRDKQKSHVNETMNKQKSHVDETRNKEKLHVDETMNKQKSHVNETMNKQKSHVDETRNKEKLHVDETMNKQKSHANETMNKQKLHVDETMNKQKSHVNETMNKQKSPVDETRNKEKLHVDETMNKQKSHVNETMTKPKSHVDETMKKQNLEVDETQNKEKSNDETRSKQRSHVDENGKKEKSLVDEIRDTQKSHADKHIKVCSEQKSSDYEDVSTKLQPSLQDKLKFSDIEKIINNKEQLGSPKLSEPSESIADVILSDAEDKIIPTVLKFNIKDVQSDTFSKDHHSSYLKENKSASSGCYSKIHFMQSNQQQLGEKSHCSNNQIITMLPLQNKCETRQISPLQKIPTECIDRPQEEKYLFKSHNSTKEATISSKLVDSESFAFNSELDSQNKLNSCWHLSQKRNEKVQRLENDLNSLQSEKFAKGNEKILHIENGLNTLQSEKFAEGNEFGLDLTSILHSEDLKGQIRQTSIKQSMGNITSVMHDPVQSLADLDQLVNKRHLEHCKTQGFKDQNKDICLSSSKDISISINKDSCISNNLDGGISSNKDSCKSNNLDRVIPSNQDSCIPSKTVVNRRYLKSPPVKKSKITGKDDPCRTISSKPQTNETPSQILSTQRSNQNIFTNEASSSCFTNQTWPFRVSTPIICESSKDTSNDISEQYAILQTRNRHERAFPIDKVCTISQSKQAPSLLVDVETLADTQETDWNGDYNQHDDLPLSEPGQIQPGSQRHKISTEADGITASLRVKPTLSEKQNTSHDIKPESKLGLPLTSFTTKKTRGKSDDSNESEMTKSNSSSQDTDSDKQSQSSEEFSKKNKSSQVESPVPYSTSIICTSNLILLGDEETTCTTFVSPSKPHYLPSEFYPPGVRAPVQEVGSHARHIRGPPEIIQKSSAPGLELSGSHSSSETDPTIVLDKNIQRCNDWEKIDSDEMLMDSVEVMNPLKLKKLKAHVETVQHLEALKSNKINSWKSIVEETFHQVFHKELKTFKEYKVLYAQGGQKLNKYSKAQILDKKMDLVRRCKPQSRNVKNLEVSGKLTCEMSASSPVSLIGFSHNPAVKNTYEKSVETGGVDKLLKQPCESKIVAKDYNCGRAGLPDSHPHSVSQDRNSDGRSVLTSFDYLARAPRKSGHPFQKFDNINEADSTSGTQKNNNEKVNHQKLVVKDYAALLEKHTQVCPDMHYNLPVDAQVSSSEDDWQEEEAKENRSAQGSPSVSPHKTSRPNKICSPLKPTSDSAMRREGSLVNVPGRRSPDLNKTFTISSDSDAVYDDDDDDTVFLNTRDYKHFKMTEPPEEISLMDASLSEFDSDVRKTPNKAGKHFQLDLGSSPVNFRNKIRNNGSMHFKKQSPGFSKNKLKSPKLNMKSANKLSEFESSLGVLSTDPFQTGKTASSSINLNALPTTVEIYLNSETEILCSRHKTFQELKHDKFVNSKYVYVEHTLDDDSDQDWQHNDGHHLNEEVIEYIRKVQTVKKKLDLDSSPAMSSPYIQVSDSLTSPPARQNLSESRVSARKTLSETKEPLLADDNIESNEKMIFREEDPPEDVEEGEILDSQDDNHVSETISKIDEELVLLSEKNTQNKQNKKNSEPAFQTKKVMNFELPSNKNPCLTADKPEVSNHRKRSRSKFPETKTKLKYFRSESGQKLSQERSKSNSLERERQNDSRKNNRERSRSREIDRDKRNLDDRRKYCDRHRDGQHPSSRDSFESKTNTLEVKSRSSSRHEKNRHSDDDSDREKRPKRLGTKVHDGSTVGDKRRHYADDADLKDTVGTGWSVRQLTGRSWVQALVKYWESGR
ncbi:hypothetical protein Btru_049532 [Bulinus truncatus]|nr:hypothetical protein Btru_049532 [Bulinus truncatus]